MHTVYCQDLWSPLAVAEVSGVQVSSGAPSPWLAVNELFLWPVINVSWGTFKKNKLKKRGSWLILLENSASWFIFWKKCKLVNYLKKNYKVNWCKKSKYFFFYWKRCNFKNAGWLFLKVQVGRFLKKSASWFNPSFNKDIIIVIVNSAC